MKVMLLHKSCIDFEHHFTFRKKQYFTPKISAKLVLFYKFTRTTDQIIYEK